MSRRAVPGVTRSARPTATRRRMGRLLGWARLAPGLVAIIAGTSFSDHAAVSGVTDAVADARTVAGHSCPLGTSAEQPVARVNLGGPTVTVDGELWLGYRGTDPGPVDPASTPSVDPTELHRTGHSGPFWYEVPVPATGSYVARLHFTHTAPRRPGGQVFSVNLEGGPAELRRLDMSAAASGSAVVKTLRAHVVDGSLTLRSESISGHPQLSAVEVVRQLGACAPVPVASVSGAAAAAESPSVPTAEPAPDGSEPPPSSTAPAAAPAAGNADALAPLSAEAGRPFAPTAAWNVPIPANPAIDPNSAAMIRSIVPRGTATANLYEYGEPVFNATAGTPTAAVECTRDWGPCDLESGPVRIPAEARPTVGSDGRMIIVDLVDRTVCDFWQARAAGPGRWTASWGTCAPLDGDGRGPNGGSTGAGVNALTGVVRTFEMRNGHIPHALSIATNNSCATPFRYPAVKSDGLSGRPDCIPEGARLQLDPAIDVDAIPGMTPGERAVARALQTYGAINRDNAGTPLAVQFETPFGEADPYPAAGFTGDYYTMPHIPWDRLRVLAG